MLPSLSLAVALALGVGAADSNVIVVKIDGKETRVTLAGATAGSERGAAFAKCLVAGRVLHVSGPYSAATVTLLDETAVATHIAEFLQTQTSSDPCTLGKAAYQPKTARAAAVAPLPVVKAKKPVREVHVSFAGGALSPESVKIPAASIPSVAPTIKTYAPPPPPSTQPTYANPPAAGSYAPQPAGTYTPPSAGNYSGLGQAGTQSALPQSGTDPMTGRSTDTVKTTTYNNPPPPQH